MRWRSLGPSFVLAPNDLAYRRVSSRNAWGAQCEVHDIAVAATDPDVIYTVSRPQTGGGSAHRSDDAGHSWTPISEGLAWLNFPASPTCVAVSPNDEQFVVLGSDDGTVHVSSDSGASWSVSNTPATTRRVNALLIDQRTTGNALPIVYAGCDGGVFHSPDGGGNFTLSLAGRCCDLAADIPNIGTANFFAAIISTGLFHATDPTSLAADGWQNLSTRPDAGPGPGMLPAPAVTAPLTSGTFFDNLQVGVCLDRPGRAYAWLFFVPTNGSHRTRALYVCDDPRTSWSMVPVSNIPDPSYDLYAMRFAVAPRAVGEAGDDVLFFCNGAVNRSTSGGQHWTQDVRIIHDDYHAIAFHPARPALRHPVTTWFGSDGGLGRSGRAADPGYDLGAAITYWNEGVALSAGDAPTNLNRYYGALAFGDLATVNGIPSLAYSGAADTGIASYHGDDTWRSLSGTDAAQIAASVTPRGVTYWKNQGQYPSFPQYRLETWTDDGTVSGGEHLPPVLLQPTRAAMNPASNLVVGPDHNCYAGVAVQDVTGTFGNAVAVGRAVVTPSSMASIFVGSRLVFADGNTVDVLAVDATTFTAAFPTAYPNGTTFTVQRQIIVRAGIDGTATAISHDMVDNNRWVTWIAVHPADPDILYALTKVNFDTAGQTVVRTTAASTATNATVWELISTGQPAGVGLSSVAITPAGQAFVLLAASVGDGTFHRPPRHSPLYEVSTGTWVLVDCDGLPSLRSGASFGQLVVDPVDPSTMYATCGPSVYRLQLTGGRWVWTDLSTGLPGQALRKLEAVDTGPPGSPHVVLRTCASGSSAWERDADDVADPSPRLYVRGNLRDVGYLEPCVEGEPDPFEPAAMVWHYQSPDVKVDALDSDHDSGTSWHQIDPEFSALPLDSVTFGQIKDNSQQLPGGEQALVHVQVHNRSDVPARNVKVWAIVAPAAAGLPSLARSDLMDNRFDFWSQFDASTGEIAPALPLDSPWQPVGGPQTIATITADRAQVVTWAWDVPLPAHVSLGHYCVAVFVHSAGAPLTSSSSDIDEVALTNSQVAQKNLHIMPIIISGGGGGP